MASYVAFLSYLSPLHPIQPCTQKLGYSFRRQLLRLDRPPSRAQLETAFDFWFLSAGANPTLAAVDPHKSAEIDALI
jgi:hypothetical protein